MELFRKPGNSRQICKKKRVRPFMHQTMYFSKGTLGYPISHPQSLDLRSSSSRNPNRITPELNLLIVKVQ